MFEALAFLIERYDDLAQGGATREDPGSCELLDGFFMTSGTEGGHPFGWPLACG